MPHQCTNCGRTFADGSKEMLSGCPDCGGNKFQFQPSRSATERSAARSARTANDSAEPTGAPESGRTETDGDAGAGTGTTGNVATGDADTPNRADERPEANVEQEMPELAKDADRENATEEGDSTTDPSRTREDVEREMPELAEDATETRPENAEYQTSTGEENAAQRDARSAPTTKEEIDEARRKMAETAEERLADVTEENESSDRRPKRGTPQGPPTEPPDEEATEEFGLSGPVGPPENQPATSAASERGSEEEPLHGPKTDLSALREELNDQFESIKITAPGQYELNLMELYDRKEYIISLQEDGRYVIDIPEGQGPEE